MKFCSNCGAPLIENSKFCNECGSSNIERSSSLKVSEDKVDLVKPIINTGVNYNVVERGPWKVFAKVGFILGLLAFIGGIRVLYKL